MFGRSWKVATVGGIPVNIDASWVWIAVLVTWSLWTQFATHYPNVSSNAALGFAVFAAALFFGSVFLHELAHAVTARLNGIKVLGITLVVFGGFTSARSEEKGPGPAFLISAVGPGTSLALGGLFWALARATEASSGPLSGALGYVGFINLLMAGFNVLPGLPLDGGRMLQAVVWRITGNSDHATRIAARTGLVVGVLLIVVAVSWGAAHDDPVLGIWGAIIGFFILQAARGSEQSIRIRDRLAGGTVADVMTAPPPAVPADMTLSEALDRFLRGHEGEAFPVVADGKVIGMVSFGSAREVGVEDPLRPVRDALIPLEHVLVASPDERLDAVSERLGTGRAALVLHDGELVGAITGRGVYSWATASR
jgi:Zn-dependent protease/predicted transcriptional regulator